MSSSPFTLVAIANSISFDQKYYIFINDNNMLELLCAAKWHLSLFRFIIFCLTDLHSSMKIIAAARRHDNVFHISYFFHFIKNERLIRDTH